MTDPVKEFLLEHHRLTRRWFMQSTAGAVGLSSLVGPLLAEDTRDQVVQAAIAKLESFMTLPADFRDVSRGKPLPHRLPDETKAQVGLTRDSWRLEVISDPDRPSNLGKQFTKAAGTALTFQDLLKLIERNKVLIPKVITCLNHGCPAGMGIWEGVPMRDVLWMTEPRADIRRVFYYGYHNDDPKQMFRSSLPPSRIFEDPYDLPPVICVPS